MQAGEVSGPLERLASGCVSKKRATNIPRRSRGYFICGQSPMLLAARVTSRWYGLAAAKGLLLATRKRVF